MAPALMASPTTQLDTLVVTSSRLEGINNLAANITVIESADIQNSPAHTLPELLAQEVGVNTTSLFSHGSRASVGIRSFGETATQNTLILLDGRRLNDIDLSSVNFSAIPFENIDRIEIVRGSGAVLYGDGATNGIINIITKDPRDSEPYAKLSATTGSFDHREANAFASYSTEQFGITANLNTINNDGYRDHNTFEQDNGQVDIRIPLGKGELYTKFGANDQEIELPGVRQVDPSMGINQLKSDRKGSDTLNDWAEQDTVFATFGYSQNINATDSFVIDTGIRQKEQTSQFDYGFGFGSYSDSQLDTFSLTPRFNFKRNLGSFPVSSTIGSDLYIYDYNSDRANFEQNKNQPIHKLNVDQKSIAIYGQSIIDINPATSVTVGWRTQRVKQRARDSYDASAPGSSMFDSEAANLNETNQKDSYEIGLKRLLDDHWSLFGRVGQSARFGTVDELFEFDGMGQQVFSALKPQTANTVEFGLSVKHKWLNSTITFFDQNLENEIRYNPVTFQNVNLDDTEHQGIELTIETQVIPYIDLSANYTYLNAEFTDGANKGNDLPLIPEHTYNVTAQTVLPAEIYAAISWNYVSTTLFANDVTNTFDEQIPSYQTVDLKLRKKIKKLELALQINNLFDEKYYNFAINSTSTAGKFNAYPLPERNAYFSISYDFD